MSDKSYVLGCCCFIMLVPTVILIACSFSNLSQLEIALDYDGISKSVSSKVFDQAGLHFLGLGHHFVKFPSTLQTMTFSEGDHDLLHLRTADGLPLVLGVSFQWHYESGGIYRLYNAFGENSDVRDQVLFNGASHIIADVACNYTSSQFFNDKQGIAVQMQGELHKYFTTHYFCSVDSLQINFMELPAEFQDAILKSITVKQNITTVQKYRDNVEISFQTNLMVSKQRAQQIALQAAGQAAQIQAESQAKAAIVNQTVHAEIESYVPLQTRTLGGHSQSLLQYIWWDSVAEGDSSAMFVGVNPAAYIKQ